MTNYPNGYDATWLACLLGLGYVAAGVLLFIYAPIVIAFCAGVGFIASGLFLAIVCRPRLYR